MQHLTMIAKSPRRQKRFPINPPARLSGSSGRSVLAKLVRAALAGIITVLLQAPMALAVPIAGWTGPWEVNTFGDGRGVTSIARSFGQTGPDGFEPLPGTPALAKASVLTLGFSLPPFSLESAAAAGVNFQRTFLLLDSPRGWIVSLNGELEGTLFSTGSTPGAAVFALAQISSPSEPDLLTIPIKRQLLSRYR